MPFGGFNIKEVCRHDRSDCAGPRLSDSLAGRVYVYESRAESVPLIVGDDAGCLSLGIAQAMRSLGFIREVRTKQGKTWARAERRNVRPT